MLTILFYLSCVPGLFFTLKQGQGTFCRASWRGIQVAVKLLGEELFTDEDKMWVGCMPFMAYFMFVFLPFVVVHTCDLNVVLTGFDVWLV